MIKERRIVVGLIGSCCAFALPITLKSDNSSVNSIDKLGGGVDPGKRISSIPHPNNMTERPEKQSIKVSFEKLGEDLNLKWKEAQESNGQRGDKLPGEQDLGKILSLEMQDKNGQVGSIKEQSWVDCIGESVGVERNCGYLGFKENGVDGKLQVNYEYWGQQNNDSGRVKVVRKDGEGMKFWSNLTNNGKNIVSGNFELLKGDNGTEWNKAFETSFIKKVEMVTS